MIISKVSSNNFGFRLSDKIIENLYSERNDLSKKYGKDSKVCRNFDRKLNLIRRIEPNLGLEAEYDYLINEDALVITVLDKDNKPIFEDNNNYKKYGNNITIDSIFDFVMKYVKDKRVANK